MIQRDSMDFADLFKAMMNDILSNKQVFVLLLLLWTSISTILIAPLLIDINDLQQMMQDDLSYNLNDFIKEITPKLIIHSVAAVTILITIPIFWCRLLLLGHKRVFGPNLLQRYGYILIRSLTLLVFQSFMIIILIIIFYLAIMMGGGPSPHTGLFIFIIILPIFYFLAFAFIYMAFCLSVTGTAIGHPGFGIIRAMKGMRRFLALYLSTLILIVISFSVLASIVSLPFLSDHHGPTRLSVLISSLMNGTMVLMVFTASAVLYRHYLMPPNLIPSEPEDAANV